MVKTAVHRLCASAMITVAKLTVLHFFVSNCSLRGRSAPLQMGAGSGYRTGRTEKAPDRQSI
jgi:hypothetical protein